MQLGRGSRGEGKEHLHSFKEFCLHKVVMMVLELAQLLTQQICYCLLLECQMQKDRAKCVFNSEEDVMRVFLICHFQKLKRYTLNVEEREVLCIWC